MAEQPTQLDALYAIIAAFRKDRPEAEENVKLMVGVIAKAIAAADPGDEPLATALGALGGLSTDVEGLVAYVKFAMQSAGVEFSDLDGFDGNPPGMKVKKGPDFDYDGLYHVTYKGYTVRMHFSSELPRGWNLALPEDAPAEVRRKKHAGGAFGSDLLTMGSKAEALALIAQRIDANDPWIRDYLTTGALDGFDAAHRKRGKECPTCNVDWWERTIDWKDGQRVPVWECPNCLHKDLRQERQSGTEITPSQERAIAQLIAGAADRGFYEVKTHTTEMRDGHAFLSIMRGRPNDEGTNIEMFRQHALFVIGRSGGIRGSLPGAALAPMSPYDPVSKFFR